MRVRHMALLGLTAFGLAQSARPREDWLWRGVVEDGTRLINMALHADLWISWDSKVCGLHQAWKGDVDWTSAPVDNSAGAQPRIKGVLYARLLDPKTPATPWTLGGVKAGARFREYAFGPDFQTVVLEYAVSAGSDTVQVRESPDYAESGGLAALTRTFTFTGIPAGKAVGLSLGQGNWMVSGAGVLQAGVLTVTGDGQSIVTGTW